MLARIADYLAIGFVAFFCSLLRILPRMLSNALALYLIKGVFLFVPRFHKVALRNLEIVFPGASRQKLETIYRQSLKVMADNFVGYARIPDFSAKKADCEFDLSDAQHCFANALKDASGKGIILATAHFCNFELLIQAIALRFRPAGILARSIKLKHFNKWWNSRREYFGNEVFDRKGAYREIESRLRKGKDVAILCDQNVKRNHAIFVNFFGKQAATTKTIALAAIRTNAPIIFGVSCSQKAGKYKVFCRPINVPKDPGMALDDKIIIIMEQIHRALEEVIVKYPDHWFWIHRRFKTRPIEEVENIYV